MHLPSSEFTHTLKRLQLNKTSALKLVHHYNQNEVLNYCRRPFNFRGKRVRSTQMLLPAWVFVSKLLSG
ncbi:hypothetical protein RB213_014481 [Colletotrichum asianum]